MINVRDRATEEEVERKDYEYERGVPFRPPRRRGIVRDRAPEVDDVLRSCEVCEAHWPQFNGIWSEFELFELVERGELVHFDLHDYEHVHLKIYSQGYRPSPETLARDKACREKSRKGRKHPLRKLRQRSFSLTNIRRPSARFPGGRGGL